MLRAHALMAPLLALLAAPAAAETLYDCNFPSRGSGWVDGQVQAVIDARGVGQAASGVAQSFAGGPVAAKVAVDNARRTTIRYEVKGTKDSGRQFASRLVYRLTVQKADGAARISMTPAGYSNTFHNGGACRVTRR